MILVIILAVLQLGDWYTTRRNLTAGGVEYNPIARWGMSKVGMDGFFGAKAALVTATACFLPDWLNLCLIALYGAVVWHNWGQMRH